MATDLNELYNDPDWLLQAGLGDIEFEQDMYDDIMYGGPSDELSGEERSQLEESLGTSLYDYDDLALMGLRKHTMEGPLRYIPSEEQKYKRTTILPDGTIKEPLGSADVDDPFDPTDDTFSRIDINFNKIINDWDPSQGTLQDFISDVYRHEYKHPLWDPYLGIRENKKGFFTGRDTGELSERNTKMAFNRLKQKLNERDPQHVPIYATGALYNKNKQLARANFKAMENVNPRSSRFAGNLIRQARYDAERAGMLPGKHTGAFLQHDRHPHRYPNQGPPGRNYNTGGIVSLMV